MLQLFLSERKSSDGWILPRSCDVAETDSCWTGCWHSGEKSKVSVTKRKCSSVYGEKLLCFCAYCTRQV